MRLLRDEMAKSDEGFLWDFYIPAYWIVKKNAIGSATYFGDRSQTGDRFFCRLGRFGPMVSVGTVEDEEKPCCQLVTASHLVVSAMRIAMGLGLNAQVKLGVYEGGRGSRPMLVDWAYIRFGKSLFPKQG